MGSGRWGGRGRKARLSRDGSSTHASTHRSRARGIQCCHKTPAHFELPLKRMPGTFLIWRVGSLLTAIVSNILNNSTVRWGLDIVLPLENLKKVPLLRNSHYYGVP